MKSLLVTADTKKSGMGYIQPKKWENIARDMFKAGLMDKMPEVKKVYTENLPVTSSRKRPGNGLNVLT
jgi:hypothetical protein